MSDKKRITTLGAFDELATPNLLIKRLLRVNHYKDRVNNWILPESNLIFASYDEKMSSNGDIILRIYKRELDSFGEKYNCYSFVVGWVENKRFIDIFGFNLTQEQTNKLFLEQDTK